MRPQPPKKVEETMTRSLLIALLGGAVLGAALAVVLVYVSVGLLVEDTTVEVLAH
jgi:hypothetical protein